MDSSKSDGLRAALGAMDAKSPEFASEAVAAVLDAARGVGASDVHLQPGAGGWT